METSKEYLSAYYRAYSRAEVARNAAARGENIPLSWIEEICQSIDLMDMHQNVVKHTR